jgi:hypothetical protein
VVPLYELDFVASMYNNGDKLIKLFDEIVATDVLLLV